MDERATYRTLADLQLAVQDLTRRMNNAHRPGSIVEIDNKRAMVKVNIAADHPTDWLPWFSLSAGNPRSWSPPKPGEHVMVISPGGELGCGYVLRGLYSGRNPAPSDSETLHLCKYDDGLELSYDTASNSLVISRPEKLNVLVKATKVEFETEKFEVKNKAGVKLVKTITDALKSIMKSKTATMMGPQPQQPAAQELPAMTKNLDSFGS
jgi:phage baseplate assembly protein V